MIMIGNQGITIQKKRALQFPDPDIPVADKISMILKDDGAWAMSLVFRNSNILGRSKQGNIILHEHSIL